MIGSSAVTSVRQTGAAQPAAERIDRLLAPSLEATGYRLVRVRLTGKGRPTLQIMVEHAGGDEVTIDECAEISRRVSALLDVEDLIKSKYLLEVSSPGIDRPLVRPEDFDRFAGHEAKIEMAHPLDGRRRFRGTLLRTGGGEVHMTLDGDEVAIAFDDIAAAQLVLTDALIAESLKREDRRRKHEDQ
jgi:ribosome maturation factor RimP